MRTLRDVNHALLDDLPRHLRYQRHWFIVGRLLMTAASTKTRLSVMLATDALVTALDAEGWRTLNPRTQPTNNQKLAPTAPLPAHINIGDSYNELQRPRRDDHGTHPGRHQPRAPPLPRRSRGALDHDRHERARRAHHQLRRHQRRRHLHLHPHRDNRTANGRSPADPANSPIGDDITRHHDRLNHGAHLNPRPITRAARPSRWPSSTTKPLLAAQLRVRPPLPLCKSVAYSPGRNPVFPFCESVAYPAARSPLCKIRRLPHPTPNLQIRRPLSFRNLQKSGNGQDAVSTACSPPRRREHGHVRAFEGPGRLFHVRRERCCTSSCSAAQPKHQFRHPSAAI